MPDMSQQAAAPGPWATGAGNRELRASPREAAAQIARSELARDTPRGLDVASERLGRLASSLHQLNVDMHEYADGIFGNEPPRDPLAKTTTAVCRLGGLLDAVSVLESIRDELCAQFGRICQL